MADRLHVLICLGGPRPRYQLLAVDRQTAEIVAAWTPGVIPEVRYYQPSRLTGDDRSLWQAAKSRAFGRAVRELEPFGDGLPSPAPAGWRLELPSGGYQAVWRIVGVKRSINDKPGEFATEGVQPHDDGAWYLDDGWYLVRSTGHAGRGRKVSYWHVQDGQGQATTEAKARTATF